MEQSKYHYCFADGSTFMCYLHGVLGYRYHWHDDMYELHIVLTGHLEFVRGQQKYLLEPDDAIFVEPGVGHTALALTPNTVSMVLRFSSKAFPELRAEKRGCSFVSDSMSRSAPAFRRLRFYCSFLLYELEDYGPYSPKAIQAYFDLLKITMLTDFPPAPIPENQPRDRKTEEDLMKKIIQYIDLNYMQKISLETLALKFQYNRTYMSTLFKRSVGINFYDYLTRTRFAHAVWDLASTDYSLTKVALYNGFPDLKTFNRHFKTIFHLPPMEYRQNLPDYLTGLPYDDWNVLDSTPPEVKDVLSRYLQMK